MSFENNPRESERTVTLFKERGMWVMQFEGFDFPDQEVTTEFSATVPSDQVLEFLCRKYRQSEVQQWHVREE